MRRGSKVETSATTATLLRCSGWKKNATRVRMQFHKGGIMLINRGLPATNSP